MSLKDAMPGEVFPITIRRSNEEQLDQAIADLEKRGFKLIKRGLIKGEIPVYETSARRGSKFEFLGTDRYDKAWAKLERTN